MGVPLRGVLLTVMYLTDAYLKGMYLIGVYLTGMYLIGIYLTGVHFRGASYRVMYFTGSTSQRRASYEYVQCVITATLIAVAFIASAWSVLLHKFSNPNSWLRRITPWLVLLGAFAYALLAFVLRSFVDMEELEDLRLGFVSERNTIASHNIQIL